MRNADNFTWKQTSAAQVRVLILVCWRQVGAPKSAKTDFKLQISELTGFSVSQLRYVPSFKSKQ